MELRKVLAVIRARKWLLIAFTLIAVASGYGVSQLLPRIYVSDATVIVGQSLSSANPDFQQLMVAQRLSQTYAEVAMTRPLLERVIDRVGLQGWRAADLRAVAGVSPLRDLNLLVITAYSRSPDEAAAIANGLAEELVAVSSAIQGQQGDLQDFLERDLAATQRQIEDMQSEVDRLLGLPVRTTEQEDRLQTLQARLIVSRQTYASLLSQLASASSNRLTVIEPAVPALGPASPSVTLNTVLGGMMGLLVALGLVFVLDYLDDTVKTREEIETLTGLSTLGLVGHFPGDRDRHAMYALVSLLYPRSQAAESFRSLRTNIEFSSLDAPLRSILVTSSSPREGKTTVAANLAVVLAQGGKETLLLDADLRKPGVHEMFRLSNDRGLTTLLRKESPAAIFATEVEGLSVLTTGPLPPNPAELLASERMHSLLVWLGQRYDFIVIDSPPLTAVTDAALLTRLVDGTILVVRARQTRRDTLRHGRDALSKVGARVLGVVLNGVGRDLIGSQYGYYGPQAETELLRATNKPATPYAASEADAASRRA